MLSVDIISDTLHHDVLFRANEFATLNYQCDSFLWKMLQIP